MKKLLAGILTASLVLSIGTISAFASTSTGGSNFVDADKDGVCDYHNTNCSYVDADGDGVCDNCPEDGRHLQRGRGFVDNDGDGICDNNDGLTNSQDGAGLQRGHRGRFVDNDSDGICDNNDGLGCSQNGTGSQRGHRGGHRK